MSTNNPPFQDAPYDDDDLINDYLEEDDFAPPDNFDEQFLEEMMEEQGGQQQPSQTVNNAVTQSTNVNDTVNNDETIERRDKDPGFDLKKKDKDEDLAMEESDKDINSVPIEVTIDNRDNNLSGKGVDKSGAHPILKNRENQLYSFERYSDKYEWRKKSSHQKREENDVMAATQWKRKITDQSHKENLGGTRPKTNAPESQLVQFLSKITEGGSASSTPSSSLINNRYKVTSNLPVENQQSSPITVNGGRMVYIPKVRDDIKYIRCDKVATVSDKSNAANSSLLEIPIEELVKRAEALERRNDRRKRFRKERNIYDDEKKLNVEYEMETSELLNYQKNEEISNSSKLWVDKYAPITFSDLLSDERTNREVLRSLRQWDPFVFQKEPPPRPQKYSYNDKQKENSSNAETLNGNIDDTTPKDDVRPDEQNRVVLLSGAPGVGKTTLAHIIARHAGYRPLEVNASDERSASILIERVTRAMESTTLNLKQLNGIKDEMAGRPNCLILDEIDGADAKSSISALVDIIRAEKPAKGSKKKAKKTYLRRPIILICNHKYATALRPLLSFACQFDVSPPSPDRLVSRLKAILGAEKMTLISGSNLLRQLVASSGGDIRSCLYTLQFASARAREIFHTKQKKNGINRDFHNSVIDISPVLNIALNGTGRGMKDIRSDITVTLRTIFKKLKLKKIAGSSQTAPSLRGVEKVLNTVQSFNDPSKTLDGMFLNLLNVSFIDPTLDRCWTAHEWLSSVDIYRSHKTSLASNNHAEHRVIQNYHIPSAAAAIHILCRVETRPELTFSLRPIFDSIYQLEANSGLINKFLEGLSPASRSGISLQGFTSEVLPFCLSFLAAGGGIGALNRAVSSIDLLTKEEKMAFDAHVEMLQALGLTYKKVEESDIQENKQNQDAMRLEPEINQVLQFQGLRPSGISRKKNDIPPVLKELLAREVNVVALRKREEQVNLQNKGKEANLTSLRVEEKQEEGTPTPPKPTTILKSNEKDAPKKSVKKKNAHVKMNFLGIGAVKAKAAKSARRKAQLGFGTRKKSEKRLSNTGSGVPLESVIRFKYQKGFTQAVRLPCSKNDFTIL